MNMVWRHCSLSRSGHGRTSRHPSHHQREDFMADARRPQMVLLAEQLKITRAVEDHRASSSRNTAQHYGKIVAEADRDLEPRRLHAPYLGIFEELPRRWTSTRCGIPVSHPHEGEIRRTGHRGYGFLWLAECPNPRPSERPSTMRRNCMKRSAFYSQIHRK